MDDDTMTKAQAMRPWGGNMSAAAREIGCTPHAILAWPDPLPPRMRDRVQAALYRRIVNTMHAMDEGAPDAITTRANQAEVEAAIATLRDYVERSTHWVQGGSDRQQAKRAVKALLALTQRDKEAA